MSTKEEIYAILRDGADEEMLVQRSVTLQRIGPDGNIVATETVNRILDVLGYATDADILNISRALDLSPDELSRILLDNRVTEPYPVRAPVLDPYAPLWEVAAVIADRNTPEVPPTVREEKPQTRSTWWIWLLLLLILLALVGVGIWLWRRSRRRALLKKTVRIASRPTVEGPADEYFE